MTTAPGSSVDVALATLVRDLERTWRDWRTLIADLQATEVQQRQAASDTLLVPPAQPVRSNLPAGTRRRLLEELEVRRQQAQARAEAEARASGAPAPSVDAISTALLAQIAAELAGERHPKRLALVWWRDELHEFDHRALLQAGLSEADYLRVGGAKRWGPLLIGGAGVCLLLGAALLMWNVVFARGTAIAETDALTIAGVAAALPQPTALAIGAVAGPASLRLDAPPVVCVDGPLRAAAQPGATLVLTDTGSIRHYTLTTGATTTAVDLVVATCRTGVPEPVAQGTLVEDHTVELLPAEQLLGVATWAADTDPQSIPIGQMQVDLDLAAAVADPTGTLVLADGTRWPPTSTVPISGGLRLRYRVPQLSGGAVTPGGEPVGLPQQAAWSRSGASGELPAVLPVALPAPTTRAAQLANFLEVLGVEASTTSATLTLTATVELAPGAPALALQQGDGTLMDARGTLLAGTWQLPALQSGEPARVVLTAPVAGMKVPLTLRLGGRHIRLGW